MNSGFLLHDLALIMAVAAGVLYLCHKFRQPPVIGYLLAGFIVGPYTPPFAFVSDVESIRSISQLGLVFLMFSLGLEFSLPRLRKAGLPAALSALIIVPGMIFTGFALGKTIGWSTSSSIFLGCILSISGSTIIIKNFFDLKLTGEPFAKSVFGIMICEDIAAMVMLSVISGLGAKSGLLALDATTAFVRIVFFILLFLIIGLLLVPKLIKSVAKFKSKELTGIVVLALCFASALIAARFGFSIALGTFLIGAIIAATEQIREVEEWIKPLRDMFSALFFVSAGMLVDPRILWSNWGIVLAIVALAVAGRTFWGSLASLLVGYDAGISLKVGLSVAQIGEFSFIIASAGAALGLVDAKLYAFAVAAAALTAFISPYLVKNAGLIGEKLSGLPGNPHAFIDRYHAFIGKSSKNIVNDVNTPVFSKYMLRLGIYATLLAGLFSAVGAGAAALAKTLPFGALLLWAVTGVVCVPLFMSIARYCDHMLLLSLTIFLTWFSPRKILQRINLQLTYRLINYLIITLLGVGFLLFVAPWVFSPEDLVIVSLPALAIGFAFKKNVALFREQMERMLDYIIGLATSEPLHQAVAVRPDSSVFLCAMPEHALKDGKRVYTFNVHAETGAAVAAIYRSGRTIANPAIEEELLPGDIVILIGDKDQCSSAERMLKSGA
ncbi:MAG: cation:proton antiporter [Elusimicrobiaceae bacterium]